MANQNPGNAESARPRYVAKCARPIFRGRQSFLRKWGWERDYKACVYATYASGLTLHSAGDPERTSYAVLQKKPVRNNRNMGNLRRPSSAALLLLATLALALGECGKSNRVYVHALSNSTVFRLLH